MAWRRPTSRLLFALGCLLAGGAVALFLRVYLIPAASMEDLGFVVGAMLLAGLAGVPFALSLVLAQRPSRAFVVVAAIGCLLALVLAVGLLGAGVTGATLLGALFLVAALVGLARAWMLRRAVVA